MGWDGMGWDGMVWYGMVWYGIVSIFIAPYSPKGGIGLVTIKVFITTI